MRSYFVYILQCADQSYYVGLTNNIERRMAEHTDGRDPKCYTHHRRPVALVHHAEFRDVWEAIAWETKLKRWGRKKKEAVIKGNYDNLPRLANAYALNIRRTRAMVRRAHHDTLSWTTSSTEVSENVSF